MIEPYFDGMDPVCPRCKAVIKPGEHDTVDTWKIHLKGHAREERNRVRRTLYGLDPLVIAGREHRRARRELALKAKELRQAKLNNAQAVALRIVSRSLPCRTPLLAKILSASTLNKARRILRKLGLAAAPNTNPIMWSLPDVRSL